MDIRKMLQEFGDKFGADPFSNLVGGVLAGLLVGLLLLWGVCFVTPGVLALLYERQLCFPVAAIVLIAIHAFRYVRRRRNRGGR